MQVYKNQLHFLRVISDIIMLVIAFIIGVLFSRAHQGREFNAYEFMLLISLLLVWIFSSKSTGLYDEFRSRNFSYEMMGILKCIAIVSISAIIVIFLFHEIHLARIFLLLFTTCSISFITIERYIFRKALTILRTKGRNLRSILIVGAGRVGWSFFETVRSNPHFGYNFIGFLDDKKHHYLNGEYIGPIDQLENVLESRQVDNVIVALPHYATQKLEEVIRICDSHTTRIKVIPDYFNMFTGKYSVSMFGNYPILSFGEDRVNEFHWRLLKRAFDVVFIMYFFSVIS